MLNMPHEKQKNDKVSSAYKIKKTHRGKCDESSYS